MLFFGMAVTASFAEGSPGNVEMILSENFDKIKFEWRTDRLSLLSAQ